LSDLAMALRARGNAAAAESLFREALAINRKVTGGADTSTAAILNNLGSVLRARGERAGADSAYREALAIRRRVFGIENESVSESMNNLATLRMDDGDLASAESLYTTALAVRMKLLGPENPETVRLLHNLGALRYLREDFAGADSLARQALALRRKTLGDEHPDVATTLALLASINRELANLVDARAFASEAVAIRAKAFGSDHPMVARALREKALVLLSAGATAESDSCVRVAAAIYSQSTPPPEQDLAGCDVLFARAALIERRFADAESHARRSLKRLDEKKASTRIYVLQAQSLLGGALTGQGAFAEAESLVINSCEGLLNHAQAVGYPRRDAFARVVTLYEGWGKPDEAAAWRARAGKRLG
jgi:tetratricopeptide (TPR) repeat protein